VAPGTRVDEIGGDDDDLREHVDGRRAWRIAHVSAGAPARDPLALAESRARHPSSGRKGSSHSDPTNAVAVIADGRSRRDRCDGPPQAIRSPRKANRHAAAS
jgi:hypothetical protein